MGKVSMTDKMRMQTLHEQGLGAKAIIAAYPEKQWKLSTVKKYAAELMKEDLHWNVVRAAEGRDLFALQQISIVSTNLFVHRKVTLVTISVLGEFQQS
jgi:hypothetical protein